MRWQPLILAALLAVPSTLAQGTFLYTFYEDPSAPLAITAHFEATAQMVASGVVDYSYTGTPNWFASHGVQLEALSFHFNVDPARGWLLQGSAGAWYLDGDIQMYVGPGYINISQFDRNDQTVVDYYSGGFWTVLHVPEPSALSLVGLSLAIWFIRRNSGEARRPPKPPPEDVVWPRGPGHNFATPRRWETDTIAARIYDFVWQLTSTGAIFTPPQSPSTAE
jgi:hypothetical protein